MESLGIKQIFFCRFFQDGHYRVPIFLEYDSCLLFHDNDIGKQYSTGGTYLLFYVLIVLRLISMFSSVLRMPTVQKKENFATNSTAPLAYRAPF